jgi:lysophospholipase L1-like esterase
MKALKIFAVLLFLVAVSMLNGCSDTAPDAIIGNLGGLTVTKYVAIGNSISAGYQSNALYESAQNYSFPKQIANQLKLSGASLGTFEQPIWGDPGNPDALTGKAARYELIKLDPVSPTVGPRGLTPGSLTNLNLPRPYDNLGVPGIPLVSFMDTTNTYGGTMGTVIIRPTSMPKSIFRQVVALKADLITFWLGNNDVLGFATSGGVSPSAPTPTATFGFLYKQAIDTLRAALPNAKIVVATIPDVKAIPFFTTVGPKIAASLITAGNLSLYYQTHATTGMGNATTKLTDATKSLIPLTASTYAPYIGAATGKWYKDKGIPVVSPIDTTKPFGVHPQNPWPDALILDSAEIVTAANAITAFNATIASVAASHSASVAVFDANALFTGIVANGYNTGAEKLTASYISGGLFSLDGVHPSSKGHGVLANEIIKVINAKWGTGIPLVNISYLPGVELFLSKKIGSEGGFVTFPSSFYDDVTRLWSGGK